MRSENLFEKERDWFGDGVGDVDQDLKREEKAKEQVSEVGSNEPNATKEDQPESFEQP